jgi:hypothetical protein
MNQVHLVSRDPKRAASCYVEMLGGKVVQTGEVYGAPKFYVAFEGGMMVNIRGKMTEETRDERPGPRWGVGHFGFVLTQDYDKYCDLLKSRGVKFVMEPMDF